VLGGLFLLLIAIGAALAYSIAGSGSPTLISGLNDFAWACAVLTSFPRAMLIMAGTFGNQEQRRHGCLGAGIRSLCGVCFIWFD
jgi:hypothetical protein